MMGTVVKLDARRSPDVAPGKPLDDERWQAVLAREPWRTAPFVYAVTTTGVYCLPGCASRRPLRRNARLFSTPDEAEAAGFRPCLRCRPEQGPAADPTRAKVLEICRLIREAERTPGLAELGARVRLHPHHLQRTFKRWIGLSPRQYAEAIRAERVKEGLRAGRPIASALYAAGFGSSSRLYERSDAELGMTPGRYRRGGAGERIRYAIVESAVGRLLVAATDRGICRVELGASEDALAKELAREFPQASLERDEGALAGWLEPLLAYLGGERPLGELPVDVRATAFQRRVWQALRRIPHGSTRSYRDVAKAIGAGRAVRAVAAACAANPVPFVIPCHRVVRKDGASGGYRLGAKLKRELLELERRTAVVLSADVVGYSRLMADDPEATVRALVAGRARIGIAVEAHGGRLVDATGDNLLAEFPAADPALRCALEIQRLLARTNASEPAARRLELRIGLHAGELLVEGERVYGSAVNVAARLEALAPPGGICLSAAVRDAAPAVARRAEDLGEQRLRNIPDPVTAYRLAAD
jgi:AraC family transcriptional regulator of adaptative response/methylated-DNA-[protein]-cysteine methyltransferase